MKKLIVLCSILVSTIAHADIFLGVGDSITVGGQRIHCGKNNPGPGPGPRPGTVYIIWTQGNPGNCGYSTRAEYCNATVDPNFGMGNCHSSRQILRTCTPGYDCPSWVQRYSNNGNYGHKCVSSGCGGGGGINSCYY